MNNTFLAALPPRDRGELGRFLVPQALKAGTIVHKPGQLAFVAFVESGLISQSCRTHTGETVETASMGSDSVVGAACAFGLQQFSTWATVDMDADILFMPRGQFEIMAEERAEVRRMAFAASEAEQAKVRSTTVCNMVHTIEQRICRWLVQAADAAPNGPVLVTHDALAGKLAVRRPSISLATFRLQSDGLIRYARGKVTILDRRGLERVACGCHRRVA